MRWLVLAAFLAALLLPAVPSAADCRNTTAALSSMTTAELILKGPEDQLLKMPVRVADDHFERAGGFQSICPEIIESTSIFFLFGRTRRPNFHMENVKAALDIAFIDRDGVIVDIQRMDTYATGSERHAFYSPPDPVAAALETRAGYFADRGITAQSWKIERLQ